MFKINENKSIYVTRGDYCDIPVVGMVNGEAYQFQVGDVVRFKATRKKDCNSVVIQRDILVEAESDAVTFHLTGDDTRIGDVISKPTDFWYEVELNPDSTDPQTIVGYDESGAKILKLFPEGADVSAEDIEVVGKKTLQDLVDDALRQAKESGEFVGYTYPVEGDDKGRAYRITTEVRNSYLTNKVTYAETERTTTLDSVAFGGKTYREIFQTGNMFQDGGFENGAVPTLGDLAPSSTTTVPVIQSNVKETGSYAMRFDVESKSGYYTYKPTLTKDHKYYVALRSMVESFTYGYIGTQGAILCYAPSMATLGEWVTSSKETTATSTGTKTIYFGALPKASKAPTLRGFVDNVCFIDQTEIFGVGNEPSKGQMDYLYEQYIHILRGDELTRERTYVLPLSYGGEFSDKECIVAFMRAANDKALSLGMTNSKFRTPSGMVMDGNENVSTAADTMKLLMSAFGHERIAEILMRKTYQSYSGGDPERGFSTSNGLLNGDMPTKLAEKGFYCFGGKGGSLIFDDDGDGNTTQEEANGILNYALLCGYEGKQVAVSFMGQNLYDASGNRVDSYPLVIDIMKKVSGSTDATPNLDEAISRADFPVSVSACVIPSGDLKAWATVDASKLIQFNGGYSSTPDALHSPASVTKLLTAIMVVENVENLDMFVEMRADDDVIGSGQELYEAETFTYWELLHLMLMESNNEAATALARAVGEKFLSKGIIMT